MPSSYADFFQQIIALSQLLMSGLYEFSSTLMWWFVTPIRDIIAYYDPLNISGIILIGPAWENLEQYSLLQVFFGAGIVIYLLWQFIAWVIDILP